MSPTLFLLPFFLTLSTATTCASNPSFQHLTIGSINATIISDGPAMVNDNLFKVPDLALKRSYSASFRSSKPSVLHQNIIVLDTPTARLMVDAGSVNIPEFPFFDTGGKLVQNMKAAGIEPESIDAVLLTHGHGDHVSGVKTLAGKKAFPNAKIYVSQKEHEFWTTDPVVNPKPIGIPDETIAVMQDMYLRSIKPYKNYTVLVPEGDSPFPGIKFIPAPGHSPGHVAIRVSSRKERLLIVGDAWITAPDQLENPEWAFFLESDELQAYETRIRLLSTASRRRDLVLAFHELFPGLGYVSENGAAFRWTPAQLPLMGTGVLTTCDGR